MSWQELQLGQMCSLRAGMVFKPDEQGAASGDMPFIKVSDMNRPENAIAIRGANNWVREEFIERTRAKPFPIGTTVFAKIGEALRQNRVRRLVRPTLIDNNMMGAIPKEGVVAPEFLYYRLSAFDIAATATGTALPYLTVSVLEQQKFQVPPLDVQRRIASILSAYDDLIENNTRRVAILEEMARRIYEEWFVRFRFPGHENVRMVESELGLVPEGWSVQGLYDVADLTYGFPFKSKLFQDDGDGLGVVRIRDIKDDKASTHTTEPADDRYYIADGDILVGMDGEFHMGRWAGGRAWLNQRVVRFRPKEGVPRSWLFWVTEGPIKHLEATIVGTTVAHLSARDLKAMRLVIPDAPTMQKAARVLEPIFDMELALKKKNANLRTTRDLLLPKLISGELDVSAIPEPETIAA